MAVRNILACRIAQNDYEFSEISINSKAKYEVILKFINNAMNKVCLFCYFFIIIIFFRNLMIRAFQTLIVFYKILI